MKRFYITVHGKDCNSNHMRHLSRKGWGTLIVLLVIGFCKTLSRLKSVSATKQTLVTGSGGAVSFSCRHIAWMDHTFYPL